MTRKKKLYLYEVGIPVEEIWVMRVEAPNQKEARRLARGPTAEQVCSVAGSKSYVRRIRAADPED
jgi:hypothetical protein